MFKVKNFLEWWRKQNFELGWVLEVEHVTGLVPCGLEGPHGFIWLSCGECILYDIYDYPFLGGDTYFEYIGDFEYQNIPMLSNGSTLLIEPVRRKYIMFEDFHMYDFPPEFYSTGIPIHWARIKRNGSLEVAFDVLDSDGITTEFVVYFPRDLYTDYYDEASFKFDYINTDGLVRVERYLTRCDFPIMDRLYISSSSSRRGIVRINI